MRSPAGLLLVLVCWAAAAPAVAQERQALIIAGASGGQEYADRYDRWVHDLAGVLTGRLLFEPERVLVLSDSGDPGTASTAANVRRAVAAIRRTQTRDDLLLVVLIGHGTFDGVDAKFNLVGPDLEAAEWAALFDGLPGRLVFVNTSAASFPFIERLSGPRRVVITATDSAAQRYSTVFAEYFIAAFRDEAADIDKNGRVSIWEAFHAASLRVRRHYEQRGQLATERALLDDNGDRIGSEAAGVTEDGSLASRTYLDLPGADAVPTDEVLLQLLQRRAALEAEAEELRIRKSFMPPGEYAAEFERLMIELARVSREVRRRSRT